MKITFGEKHAQQKGIVACYAIRYISCFGTTTRHLQTLFKIIIVILLDPNNYSHIFYHFILYNKYINKATFKWRV